jgi:hypothetical protein
METDLWKPSGVTRFAVWKPCKSSVSLDGWDRSIDIEPIMAIGTNTPHLAGD